MIVFLSRFGSRVRDLPEGLYGGQVLRPTLIVAAFEAAVEETYHAP